MWLEVGWARWSEPPVGRVGLVQQEVWNCWFHFPHLTKCQVLSRINKLMLESNPFSPILISGPILGGHWPNSLL